MNPHSAYPFKRIPKAEADLFNRLFRKDPGLTFNLGPDAYGVRFEPNGSDLELPAPMTAHISVDHRIRFELRPEEHLLVMLLSDVASLEDLKSLSEELRGVAMEAALEKVLDHIDGISGARSTIDRMTGTRERSPARINLGFTLTRRKDGCRGKGILQTDVDGLEWITARLSRLSTAALRSLDHLPVAGRMVIGSAELTLADISDLEPCDIILNQGTNQWSDREARVCFGTDLTLTGNIVPPDRFLIQEVMKDNRETGDMIETKENIADAQEVPLEGIPVKLIFEIGQADMTVGELRRLQPGYTIQLDDSVEISKPVTIKANGVGLGIGEIVQIDDRLGIRVLDFNAQMLSSEP